MVLKRKLWFIFLTFFLTVATFGSSQAAEVKTEEVVIVDKFIRTADNFIIMYDASGSMSPSLRRYRYEHDRCC
jgi:hypothetical protein